MIFIDNLVHMKKHFIMMNVHENRLAFYRFFCFIFLYLSFLCILRYLLFMESKVIF